MQGIWAIMPERIHSMMTRMAQVAARTEDDAAANVTARRSVSFDRIKGGIAVIPIHNEIVQHADFWSDVFGMATVDGVGAMLDTAINDDSVGAVVLRVDSPGGSVYGIDELSAKIYGYRGTKPIIAVADSLMASAAYYVASAADQIVVTPGGEIGSVGVVAMHVDYSEMLKAEGIKPTVITAGPYKWEANPYQPLGDEAKAAVQARVDEYYEAFIDALARNRGASRTKVKKDFGGGRVVGASAAVQQGMADVVAPFDRVIRDMLPKTKTMSRNAAALEIEKVR